ncbi:MAG: hypothetical protein ACYCVN_11890 [Acidimicrobiales bacterium]
MDRFEGCHAQSQRVDDAEAGISDKRHEVGMQLSDELERVAISCDRRTDPSDRLDEVDVAAPGPFELGATRSATANGARPSVEAAIGEAIGTA